jgi:hypothetical protein
MLGFEPIGGAPLGAHFPLYRIKAEHTKEGQERLKTYYAALGRFVDLYSRVETAVTLTLWHYAQTTPEIAKIVFAGATIGRGSAFIKELATATGAPQELQADLKNVIQQLDIIKEARNIILHYGASSVAEGNAIVSNALKAKGTPSTFPISPDILDDMASDLKKILAHLNELHLKERSEHTLLTDPETHAWQYKRPSKPKKQSKRGGYLRAQKRGPKPPHPP